MRALSPFIVRRFLLLSYQLPSFAGPHVLPWWPCPFCRLLATSLQRRPNGLQPPRASTHSSPPPGPTRLSERVPVPPRQTAGCCWWGLPGRTEDPEQAARTGREASEVNNNHANTFSTGPMTDLRPDAGPNTSAARGSTFTEHHVFRTPWRVWRGRFWILWVINFSRTLVGSDSSVIWIWDLRSLVVCEALDKTESVFRDKHVIKINSLN